ncbi:uncharacterized protein LOC129224464 [Uloborus diversus]|uniref:uncharacterized protein LOC129224464 n=1 Tax=Uloborus diversus TaxID=327109 RepID=UPI0024098340|nr:uncharacterized protein LOC129224464 [Uloborus diversus]
MSGLPFGNASNQQKDRIQWASGSLLDDSSETASQFSNQSFSRSGSKTLRAPDIGVRMRNLYKSEKFADVKFIIKKGKKSKSSILAHKAILAVGSTKFEEMLFGPGSYGMSPKDMLEIEINNVSFGAFRNIVEYLYTDEVYFEDDSLVVETFVTAKNFEIQPLVDKCEAFFESRELSEENVCSMLNLSVTNKIEALKNRCIQFIQENTSEILRTQKFLECNITTIRTIFKLQELSLRSEAELFEAAMRWSCSCGVSNHRNQIEPLLKCIRFLTMSPNVFSSLVKHYPNILSSKEALDIMMFITNPPRDGRMAVDLPTWCNKETKNRCLIRPASGVTSSFADLSLLTDRVDKLTIALRPFNPQNLDALKSFLEMRCIGGRHQITAVKLVFQEPVTAKSRIGYLVLRIFVFPSGFRHEEHIRIQNSSEVTVKLKKIALAKNGDIVRIEADAKEVENYKFYQFDPNKPSVMGAPFECTIASMPKWEKLYFISEVHYGPQKQGMLRKKR